MTEEGQIHKNLISDREDLEGSATLSKRWFASSKDQAVSTLRFDDGITFSRREILELEATSLGRIGRER